MTLPRNVFLGRPCEGLADLIRLLREADQAGTPVPYDLPSWGPRPGARRLSRVRGGLRSWGPEGVLVYYEGPLGGWGVEYV